jgi:hypothetical protein
VEHAITFNSYRTLSPFLNPAKNRKEIMQVEVRTRETEEKTGAKEEEKTDAARKK